MMEKFKYRSDKLELLDTTDIPKALLYKNLHELDLLNKILGSNRISLNGIIKLLVNKNKCYHIVDLGCGSGYTMRFIADWARTKGIKVKLTGVDMNADTINYLKEHCSEYPEIQTFTGDYRDFLKTNDDIDIINCSLFCHHLKDEELTELFKWCQLKAKAGFVINDLQRNWMAYYLVQFFTLVFNASRLAKNDGPISVLRGFKKKELIVLLNKAQIKKYSIKRKWAFRFLIVGRSCNSDM